MNSRDLFISFNEVDEDILERSEQATVVDRIPVRRRLSIMLIAAILALFLLGAAAVTGLFGDSVQSWFGHYWEQLTGQPMSDQQTALINHLSQKIGFSGTVEDITVTVDSATVGEDCFWILLRVEGMAFSKKHAYGFAEAQVELSPEATEDAVGMGCYSFDYLGLDADGAALLLIDYSYEAKAGLQEEKSPLKVTLSMTDFFQNPRTNKRILLAEGEWQFTFTMERNKLDTRHLPDTQVTGMNYTSEGAKNEIPIILTNIELTNTGLCFQYDWQNGDAVLEATLGKISIILDNGQQIGAGKGAGSITEDGCWYCTYTWKIPVELDEVAAIKIGEVVIPVK